MVRLYGNAPYSIVLVHGGPGAIGSLKGFAKELSEASGRGVVEAIQSKYSVWELIKELRCQIEQHCDGKAVLIGHSFGAWLAALLAADFQAYVKSLILIGCPPLEEKYVSQINQRRLQNISGEDAAAFQRLLDDRADDGDMEKISLALEKSDHYCLENRNQHLPDKTDSQMYQKVWKEAAALRADGSLLKAFCKISCKISLIQGAYDPHPVKGVTEPLEKNGFLNGGSFEAFILEKCGHCPFMEKEAKGEFYRILLEKLLPASFDAPLMRHFVKQL